MSSALPDDPQIHESAADVAWRKGASWCGSTGERILQEAGYTGQMIEKREVDLINRDEYEPSQLPPEWVAWLHKYRMEPPTPEETVKIANARTERAAKIAKLEADEEQRKFRLASLQSEGMAADSTPNMKRYVEQLTSLGYGKKDQPAQEHNKPTSDDRSSTSEKSDK